MKITIVDTLILLVSVYLCILGLTEDNFNYIVYSLIFVYLNSMDRRIREIFNGPAK